MAENLIKTLGRCLNRIEENYGQADLPAFLKGFEIDLEPHMPKSFLDAAVLIAIIMRSDGPKVIFTQRSSALRVHSGQISFPGGGRQDDDFSPLQTALRESEEEIGLPPTLVKALGQSDVYFTGTGYAIRPIVAIIENGFDFSANPHEVEEIFEVPLEFILNKENHKLRHIRRDGKEYKYFEIYYDNRRIWGVTAGMIRALSLRLEVV